MFKISVRYGISTETLESDNPITIGSIRQNLSLRARLGFGDNVTCLIDGVDMPNEAIVPSGALVVVETACNNKAVIS